MEAIILAGGFGTRLQSIVRDVPKPMAPIQNKPFLDHLCHYLKKQGISKIIFSVCHKRELIKAYFGDAFDDIEVVYSLEEEALGTGGAIKQSLEMCESENIIILNGDTFFDLNLKELLDTHIQKNADLTLALKPMEKFDRYGVVQINDSKRIIGFLEKQYADYGLINGGVYVIQRDLLESVTSKKFSFETYMIENFQDQYFYAMIGDGYFIDIGIPEDYFRAQQELTNVI